LKTESRNGAEALLRAGVVANEGRGVAQAEQCLCAPLIELRLVRKEVRRGAEMLECFAGAEEASACSAASSA
jgi:hypothetical protein